MKKGSSTMNDVHGRCWKGNQPMQKFALILSWEQGDNRLTWGHLESDS